MYHYEQTFALEEEQELDYPSFRPLQEAILASSSATSVYNPALRGDTTMNTPRYHPATGKTPPIKPDFEGASSSGVRFKRGINDEMWDLPSAKQSERAMFVIPQQIGLFHDAFSRWESITRNRIAEKGFTDVQDKADFIENLLGDFEKLIWIQWRMTYPAKYQTMLNSAEGREGTNNILAQMRMVFSLEDPAQRTTGVQDQAYRDLERLSCSNIKYIVQYMNDYLHLAAKSGRMWVSPELSEKFWLKMPGDLGDRIKKRFDERYPTAKVGVVPRILYAYQYLEQKCKDAAFTRSLKNISF